MSIIRAAITQATWTGDQESMVTKHAEFVRTAAEQHVQVICFQELFHAPYFGVVQDARYHEYAQRVPGPLIERFQKLADAHRMVIVLPVYERDDSGVLYNSAAVIDADGTYLGKYRKHHIPNIRGGWEKFYFRNGDGGYPVFDTGAGRIGVYICYDRHFPEGWRALGLAGAEIVFNPSATKPVLSNRLWELEQPAAAVANQYYIGANNRIGTESDEFGPDAVTFYGRSYFVDPRGNFVGEVASDDRQEIIVRDLDIGVIRDMRSSWQFYRNRRPDSYGPIVA